MKSFWRNFGKHFFYEKFLANFRRTTSYPDDITAKSPKVRHRVATSGDFWGTLATVFRRTKRFAASLPQTSPFGKGSHCIKRDVNRKLNTVVEVELFCHSFAPFVFNRGCCYFMENVTKQYSHYLFLRLKSVIWLYLSISCCLP